MTDRKRVLVVDDEEDVRLFLEDFLSERDLEVDSAENGLAALEKMEAKSYDLVLLDIMMPRMDGLECLSHIHKKYPHTVVVMLTALKDEARMQKARDLGASLYIVKPFSLDLLEAELAKLLNRTPR